MKFIVKLIAETGNSTLSALFLENPQGLDHFIGFVVEDGYRHVKVRGETRIPGGVYNLKKRTYGGHYERYKKKYGHEFVVELVGVPGFTDILVHIGNDVDDTEGCLLLNTKAYLDENNLFKGEVSTVLYKRWYEMTKAGFDAEENIIMEVIRDPMIEGDVANPPRPKEKKSSKS